MPHIAVNLYPGRDGQTKREIAEKTERFFATTFGFADNEVSVSIVELAPDEFVPTIQDRYPGEELFVASRYITADGHGDSSAS
ncbi:MAG: tautomerase family protein [Propionibacterium sp.]